VSEVVSDFRVSDSVIERVSIDNLQTCTVECLDWQGNPYKIVFYEAIELIIGLLGADISHIEVDHREEEVAKFIKDSDEMPIDYKLFSIVSATDDKSLLTVAAKSLTRV
jgi:hypothetical protein